MTRLLHHFGGWKPSACPPPVDCFKLLHRTAVTRPVRVSARAVSPPIRDQGQEGSCTGFAGTRHLELELGAGLSVRSPADLYWQERVIEGTTGQDSGASMHDCMEVMVKTGVGSEEAWPYVSGAIAAAPPLGEPETRRALASSSELVDEADMLDCLAAGHSFIFGVRVYESFESEHAAVTGLIPMPRRGEQLLGGHAQCAIGYDLDFHASPTFERLGKPRGSEWKTVVEVANSWGTGWGDQGYAWYPLEFLTDRRRALASEFLTGRP